MLFVHRRCSQIHAPQNVKFTILTIFNYRIFHVRRPDVQASKLG